MPVTKFPCLTIWLFCQRRPFQIFGQFRGFFKETNSKNWEFCVNGKKRRKKHGWQYGSKMLSSSNMGTEKGDQKERELIFNFKIFKYE